MIAWLKKLLGGGAAVAVLSPTEAHDKARAGAIILDVRTPQERQQEKIPHSQALPLDKLAQGWEKLPRDREIICQCASGGRSARAARFLAGKGFTVYNLAGGLLAWKQHRLPVK